MFPVRLSVYKDLFCSFSPSSLVRNQSFHNQEMKALYDTHAQSLNHQGGIEPWPYCF